MKILIFILLLIPAFGFAQINTEALNSFPGGNFNLYSIDAKSIEGYSFKATTSQNALASSNLNLDDEYKMLLDSFYLYYFNYQSDTTTVIREYYQYDNHGNQTLFSKYIPCESCVEVTRKIESSYDEDGHLLMKMSFYWDYIRKLWINGRKDIYTYELNGSLTSISNWWDEKDGLWKDTVKIVKSYDVHGNILLEISSRYESNTGLWINLTKNKYSYKDGKCTIHISYKWDEGTSQWTNVSKEESEFNVNGNENVFSNYYWKSLSNQWVSSSRVIESYSPEGKMINYIHFRWDTTSTQWINVHKEDYTFDSNGNEILKIYWD